MESRHARSDTMSTKNHTIPGIVLPRSPLAASSCSPWWLAFADVRSSDTRSCLPGPVFSVVFVFFRGGGLVGGGIHRCLVFYPCARTTISKHEAKQGGMRAGDGGSVNPRHVDSMELLYTLGGSRRISALASVSLARSLLWPYLLEEVRTRVEMEDEEVRAVGRTYCTPRRLLVPSTTRVEGRAPVLAPYGRGGGGGASHPFPGACVSTSKHSDTASVSAIRKWRLLSGRTLSPPGPLPPSSAMQAPEVRWQ